MTSPASHRLLDSAALSTHLAVNLTPAYLASLFLLVVPTMIGHAPAITNQSCALKTAFMSAWLGE